MLLADDGTTVIEEVTTAATRLTPVWVWVLLGLGAAVLVYRVAR